MNSTLHPTPMNESVPNAPPDAASTQRHEAIARLMEALAYLGAALILAGLGTLVARVWENLSDAARVGMISGTAVLLWLGGLAIGRFLTTSWTRSRLTLRTDEDSPRRRLTSVLMLGGSLAAAFAVAVAIGTDNQHVLLPAAATGLVLGSLTWWMTGTVLAELAMGGAGLAVLGGINTYTDLVMPWPLVVVFVLSLAWTAAATFGLLEHRTVSQFVGLLLALNMANNAMYGGENGPGEMWPAYVLLGLLAAISLVAFWRIRDWPFVVFGGLSAFFLVVRLITEYTHGATTTLALMASGIVLMVAAGLVWRKRSAVRGTEEAALMAAPTVQPMGWALPETEYREAFILDPTPLALVDAHTLVLDANAAMVEQLHAAGVEQLRGSVLDVLLAEYHGPVSRRDIDGGHHLVALS